MAQETSEEQLLTVVIKAARITKNNFANSIKAAIKHKKTALKEGKQSIDSLVKDGSTLQNIEVTDQNIKSFEESAKKYNVSYALKKDSASGKYFVFFKGKDTEQVYKAFNHYAKNAIGNSKPKLNRRIEQVHSQTQTQDKNRERVKERQKDRGMQL